LRHEVGDNAQAQLRSSPFPLFSAPGKPTLPSDMIVVVYHIVDDEVLAFICIGGELHLLRHLATTAAVQQLLQRLTAQWARFRIGQPFIDRHQPQLEQSARRLLQMAYTALLAPVEALLHKLAPCTTAPVCNSVRNSVRNLVIVPHRFLHQLPFHALYDGEHYLIERYAISYAPSATVFALCQQRPLRDDGLALVVAAPDAQIPAATLEATQVAQHLRTHFADVRLLLNEDATLPAVTTLANQCSRLHLACHGLFRADNPLFSAIKLFDGWLTATHVAQLKLSAPEFPFAAQPGAPYTAPGALVTLSACESGRSQVMGGDENIGLVYAFLSAGAATLLVSQWLVHDEIAARFMDQWYTQLAGATDLAAALRTAQLSLLADYPHPYYWAPFVLIGQRSAKNNPYAPL
jgi:CHAT domain-containing protein